MKSIIGMALQTIKIQNLTNIRSEFITYTCNTCKTIYYYHVFSFTCRFDTFYEKSLLNKRERQKSFEDY